MTTENRNFINRPLEKIFICANFKKERTAEIFPRVAEILGDYGCEIFADETAERFLPTVKGDYLKYVSAATQLGLCDAIITIGGDGTILRWGKKAAALGKPLLGINTGRLGFMATLESDELKKLKGLRSGQYKISRRMLLDVAIPSDKDNNDEKPMKRVALNDVVFYKNVVSKLPEFYVLAGGIEVSRIRADGMIFGTPTGSTAYSLSAGGPIIEPELECIEMTPLCAHSLFGRPMLFSAGKTLEVGYDGYETSDVFVSVDGDEGIPLRIGDKVRITRSECALSLIDLSENSFYSAVHNKLMRPLK